MIYDLRIRMRGQEMTLKTEADNTVCASFYVYKQPRWQ